MAKRKGKTENLRPLGDGSRTKEEERRIRVEGGKKSGETRRRQRDLTNMAKKLLKLDVSPNQSTMRNIMKSFGIDDEDMSYGMAILAAQLVKAANGNTEAAKYLRDTAGENPMIEVKKEEANIQKRSLELQEKRAGLSNEEIADDGFIEAIKGSIDNSDWGEDDD